MEEKSRGSVRRSTFSYLCSSLCFDQGKMWSIVIPSPFTLQRWCQIFKTFESWVGDGCWIAHKLTSLPFICRASACKCNVLWLTNTIPNLDQQPGRIGSCTPLDMFVQLFMPYSQLIHLFWQGQDVFIFCLAPAFFIIFIHSLSDRLLFQI